MSSASRVRRLLPKALLALLALLLVGVLLVLWSGPAEAQSTFTVNNTGDGKDRKINGVCDSSRRRGKQCTLRAAIEEANATLGADTINFNIGGTAGVKTISPASELPSITESVTIDGYTQRGASENTLATGNDAVLKVQLNGTNAGDFNDGLVIRAPNSTIRGLVINRFDSAGVFITGSGVTGNKIEGNFIGTNAAGTASLGNSDQGVFILTTNNTIGGTAPAQRNIISGNTKDGVRIVGADDNEVLGNFIGTTADGTGDLGNGSAGVALSNTSDNTIGDTATGARNVISGNDGDGVFIENSVGSATGNKIEGNRIGTSADGSADLGNSDDGVDIEDGASSNTIGGTANEARNIISGNDGDGVFIFGSETTGNEVLGNFIGTNASGTANLGNGSEGVSIEGGASSNTIGGTASGERNTISGNGGDGVEVFGTGTRGNSILSNQIFSNDDLGIDLGGNGVTNNDTDDPDTGPNNLQNYPVITSATSTGFTTTIQGTLNSNPNQSFTIQCFLTEEGGDPSGHGEGLNLLDTVTVRTDANGDSSPFSCVRSGAVVPVGRTVSATATNTATGDTSEFSENEVVR